MYIFSSTIKSLKLTSFCWGDVSSPFEIALGHAKPIELPHHVLPGSLRVSHSPRLPLRKPSLHQKTTGQKDATSHEDESLKDLGKPCFWS